MASYTLWLAKKPVGTDTKVERQGSRRFLFLTPEVRAPLVWLWLEIREKPLPPSPRQLDAKYTASGLPRLPANIQMSNYPTTYPASNLSAAPFRDDFFCEVEQLVGFFQDVSFLVFVTVLGILLLLLRFYHLWHVTSFLSLWGTLFFDWRARARTPALPFYLSLICFVKLWRGESTELWFQFSSAAPWLSNSVQTI